MLYYAFISRHYFKMYCDIPSFKLYFLLLLLNPYFILAQTHENSENTAAILQKIKSSQNLKGASFSWAFQEVETRKILWEYQSDNLLCPASTLKLITTGMALKTLGKDYRFQTNVFRDAEVNKGVLNGNLIIVGSGDPSLGSGKAGAKPTDSLLLEILNMLKFAGINQINGYIHIDDSCFPSNYKSIPMDRPWEDVGNYYGAGIWGLNWRNNSFELEIQRSESGFNILKPSPKLAGYTFNTYLENKPKGDIYIYSNPWSDLIQVGGQLEHGKSSTIKGAIPYPPKQMGQELIEFLNANGINCSKELKFGSYIESESANMMVLLGSISSPELYKLITETNNSSNNLFADCLLRASMGSEFQLLGLEEIATEQQNRLRKLVESSSSSIRLRDGSGMSRSNLISSRYITDMLTYFYTTNDFTDFWKSIPEPGKKGALKQFPILKDLYVKTGSMAGVRAYAGYINKDNKWIAFSVMVNNCMLNWSDMNALFIPLFQSIIESK